MSATKLINKFKEYVPTERDSLGTVASLIPKGKLRLIPGTIKRFNDGVKKAIGVILTNQEGESTTLPCSKAVSATVVSALEAGVPKVDVLAIISKLEVTQFEHDKTGKMCQVISAPVGEGSTEEEFLVTALAKNTKQYEDLG